MSHQDTCWSLGPQVVFTRLSDDESVLLHLDSKRYYSLNETGTLLCDQLQEQRALPELAAALAASYDISEEEALVRATQFVETLRDEHLAYEHTAA